MSTKTRANCKHPVVCLDHVPKRAGPGDRARSRESLKGPVAAMQQVRILSTAFLTSALQRSKSADTSKEHTGDRRRDVDKLTWQKGESLQVSDSAAESDSFTDDSCTESWDEPESEIASGSGPDPDHGIFGDGFDSISDDFQSKSDTEKSSNDNAKDTKQSKRSTQWPGGAGDAAQPSSPHGRDTRRSPSIREGNSRMKHVLRRLNDTLKTMGSETRPTTPTVSKRPETGPTQNGSEPAKPSSVRYRSSDPIPDYHECTPWAAWYLAKKKKLVEKRKLAEKRAAAEMEERAMEESRRILQMAAYEEWLQRKEAEMVKQKREREARLHELRELEKQRQEAAMEASKRACAEWLRRKNQQLRERRLEEEKARSEAKTKEAQRREIVEKGVREWRRLRTAPCALTASTYVNPTPWLNLVEISEEADDVPQRTLPPEPSRPRRTRRDQERICTRLSRPTGCSKFSHTSRTDSDYVTNKPQPSWVQRVRRSQGYKRAERNRAQGNLCFSDSNRTVTRASSLRSLDRILASSRSEFKSPAARTSDWIESVLSRRIAEENGGGDNTSTKPRSHPCEAADKPRKDPGKKCKPQTASGVVKGELRDKLITTPARKGSAPSSNRTRPMCRQPQTPIETRRTSRTETP